MHEEQQEREEQEAAAAKQRERRSKLVEGIGLLLHFAMPVVVFGLYYFFHLRVESITDIDNMIDEMGFIRSMFSLLLLPVIISAIASVIIDEYFIDTSPWAFILIPIASAILLAGVLSNGFWGFIGYLIVAFIIGNIATIPGRIVYRIINGIWP